MSILDLNFLFYSNYRERKKKQILIKHKEKKSSSKIKKKKKKKFQRKREQRPNLSLFCLFFLKMNFKLFKSFKLNFIFANLLNFCCDFKRKEGS